MQKDEGAQAKITRPRLARICQRKGLHGLLDELSFTPLIMVSGASGTGKTTLVASYVDCRNISCLWYQLDRADENLATFFHYLSVAAINAVPNKKDDLPRVPSQYAMDSTPRIKEYFHKMFRCLETPFLMVFDNYHEIPADAPLHDLIQAACAELPRGGRIILISRNECPPNMACVITNRTTAVIGDEDLQLSPAEAIEIASLHGVTLPCDDVTRKLDEKAGGWTPEIILNLKKEWPAPFL
jgi:LuxR family maltose regulon positive regulatory protein